jgi:hypothetical protein
MDNRHAGRYNGGRVWDGPPGRFTVRYFNFVPLAIVLTLVPCSGRAQDVDADHAVLARALQAHGGAAAITKTRQMVRKVTGIMSFLGKELPFTAEETMDLPDRFRAAFELSVAGQKYPLTLVIDGKRGWRATGGMVQDLAPEELQELKEELYVWWLATLVPLKDKSFALATVPEVQVDGRPAAGLKVVRVGHEDVRLFFDRASGLLVKVERRGKEMGAVVAKEYLFGGHKNFDGLQLPTKYTNITNGKKIADVSSISYRLMSRFEDGTFSRP